jgi:hypothetical protein
LVPGVIFDPCRKALAAYIGPKLAFKCFCKMDAADDFMKAILKSQIYDKKLRPVFKKNL